jgi:hypothetical protein
MAQQIDIAQALISMGSAIESFTWAIDQIIMGLPQ